jgi:hypothetical protein
MANKGFERNWKAKARQASPPYTEWEDYKLGLFGDTIDLDKRENYANLLKTSAELKGWMTEGVKLCPIRWGIVIKTKMNYQAWLGAIAGLLYCGCNDATTRSAWGLLTNEEQTKANAVADEVHKESLHAEKVS